MFWVSNYFALWILIAENNSRYLSQIYGIPKHFVLPEIWRYGRLCYEIAETVFLIVAFSKNFRKRNVRKTRKTLNFYTLRWYLEGSYQRSWTWLLAEDIISFMDIDKNMETMNESTGNFQQRMKVITKDLEGLFIKKKNGWILWSMGQQICLVWAMYKWTLRDSGG